MTVASGLALIPCLMIGFAVVQLLVPETGLTKSLFKLFLGAGLGMGITACLFYFWRLVLPAQDKGYLYFEIVVLVVLWLAVIWRGFQSGASEDVKKIEFNSVSVWILFAAIAVMTVIGGLSFIAYQKANPHGAYDAYAIWNLHARMMFRGGESWQSGFSSHLYHADYPLLLPASIARVWYILQEETIRASMVVPVVYVVSTAGLLFSALWIARSALQAALAVVVLTGTAWFVEVASIQYADLPLAYYILATGAPLYLYWRSKGTDRGMLVLGGMAVGMAAWTKNEGVLFFIAVTGISIATIWFTNRIERIKTTLRFMMTYGMGLLLPAVALISFKIGLAPPNDLVSSQNMPWVMQALTDVQRYVDVAQNLSAVISNTWQVWMLVGLSLYMIGVGPDERIDVGAERTGLRVILAVFCVMLVSVVGIYVLSPWTPEVHIRTSAGRLLMQILPLFLLNIFLISGNPGYILEDIRSSLKRN